MSSRKPGYIAGIILLCLLFTLPPIACCVNLAATSFRYGFPHIFHADSQGFDMRGSTAITFPSLHSGEMVSYIWKGMVRERFGL